MREPKNKCQLDSDISAWGIVHCCILWLLWFQNFKSRRFRCVMWAHFLGKVLNTVIQQYVFGPIFFLRKWFPCSACSLGPNLFSVFVSTLIFIMVLANKTESWSRPLLCRFCKDCLQRASWACPITSLMTILPLGNCSAGLWFIVMLTLIRWAWALFNKEILGSVGNPSVSFAPLWHCIVPKDCSSGVGALQIWWNLVLGIWLWPKDSYTKLKFVENFWRHLKFDHSS